MLVHVVNAANRALYLDELEAMHRHRYRIFVDLMGWRALACDDRLDIDEFDNQGTTYLLAIDEDGVLRGSARLIPTWRPHMLQTLFPEYADEPAPMGPQIWEWTRHAPGDPTFPSRVNARVKQALQIGMLEFAASRGVDAFTGILETRMLGHAVELGWRIKPLGAPRDYGEGTAVGVIIRWSNAFLEQSRARAGRYDPVLVEMPGGVTAAAPDARRSIELAMRMPPDRAPDAVARLQNLMNAP